MQRTHGQRPRQHTDKKCCGNSDENIKDRASREEVAAGRQRVRRAVAQAWRKKTEEIMAAKPQRAPDKDELSTGTGATDPLTDDEESVVIGDILSENNGFRMDGLHATCPVTKKPTPNVMLQDDLPSQNTRSKTQSLLSAIEMSGSCPSARQSTSCSFPL